MNAPVKSLVPFIPSWTAGGRLENLADPASLTIDFAWISATLSGLARFNNKQDGAALSVAQHCVQGADALYRETGDAHFAGLFLLHDGHEAWLQDVTTPLAKLIGWLVDGLLDDESKGCKRFERAWSVLKADYDRKIYTAAGYASPHLWTEEQKRLVHQMDSRMGEIEAYELFGPSAFSEVPHSGRPSPKLTGSICPTWAPMKAEEAFNARLKKYCGIDVRLNPRGIA